MEFPTVAHVWLAQEKRGARVAWAPVRNGTIDAAEYDALVDDRTGLVSACQATTSMGASRDSGRIAKIARAAGALSFVDAYQTLGTVPVDVRALGVDFLASGNLKFLMGIPGIAFLYVRPEIVEHAASLRYRLVGSHQSVRVRRQSLDWSPTASRFERARRR